MSTSGLIPIKIITKMSTYDVKSNGFDLKVTVADRADMIIKGLAELRNQMSSSKPIVGLNIFDVRKDLMFPLLQLCAGNHCLTVVWSCVNPLPKCLKEFLDDPNICFVGSKLVFSAVYTSGVQIRFPYGHEFARGMYVKEFAARALKKPKLLEISLRELVAELGICLDDSPKEQFYFLKKLSSSSVCIFTEVQVKSLVRYSHVNYIIGKKLLSLLN